MTSIRLNSPVGAALALATVLIAALTFTLTTVFAQTVPKAPHNFFGTVTVSGADAADETIVAAEIDGIVILTTTTSSGQYGFSPLFKVPSDDVDTEEKDGGVDGDTVRFRVGGVLAEETFTFLSASVTELNLTVIVPDTTPPAVASTVPADGAANASLSGAVSATFNEAMDGDTITTASFTLSDGGAVSGTVSYDGPTLTATFTPDSALASGTLYTATITTSATDVAGNALGAQFSWEFTTVETAGLTADAGGPYTVNQGANVTLSGSGTGGVPGLSFAWDLDGGGDFDDATGSAPSVSFNTPGAKSVVLRVTDSAAATDTDAATVVVAFFTGFYDANDDGITSKNEALAAVTDFNADDISKDEAIAVIQLYFAG